MSVSVPSIDPKTVAIGAAVVVAGIGAYIILSEPPLTKEQQRQKDIQDTADKAGNEQLGAIIDNTSPALAAALGLGLSAVQEGEKFFVDKSKLKVVGKDVLALAAKARDFLNQGQLDLAMSNLMSARHLLDSGYDSNGFVTVDYSKFDPDFPQALRTTDQLYLDLVDAYWSRDNGQLQAVSNAGNTELISKMAAQMVTDEKLLEANDFYDIQNATTKARFAPWSTAVTMSSTAAARADEEQGYRTLILRGLNLPADQYIALAEPYIIKWGQSTYDEKVGNRYTQYYGLYHTYQDKKNSTNPHDLDDAMTALNQLPDWIISSAERTSFSERRGQAALTAAHISQEDAEKQLSAIFGNLGSAASKLGTVFVKK